MLTFRNKTKILGKQKRECLSLKYVLSKSNHLDFKVPCSPLKEILNNFPTFQSSLSMYLFYICTFRQSPLFHSFTVWDFYQGIVHFHWSSKNIALGTKMSRYQNKFVCFLIGKNLTSTLKISLQLLTDSLADNECFLSAYPDSHKSSIHLAIVVAGTANPHPQEPEVGNEGPNSQIIART